MEVCGALRAKGIYPWVDIEQIPPGQWFQDYIQKVIPNVRAAAIFIGPGGIGRWQSLEIKTFVTQCLERSLPVIPVLLPGVENIPKEYPFLKELNWVKFQREVAEEKPISNLIWGITGKQPS